MEYLEQDCRSKGLQQIYSDHVQSYYLLPYQIRSLKLLGLNICGISKKLDCGILQDCWSETKTDIFYCDILCAHRKDMGVPFGEHMGYHLKKVKKKRDNLAKLFYWFVLS